MGVPPSEVGYTPAMPRREDHEVHKDMGGIGQKKKKKNNAYTYLNSLSTEVFSNVIYLFV